MYQTHTYVKNVVGMILLVVVCYVVVSTTIWYGMVLYHTILTMRGTLLWYVWYHTI
jgi:hypothetical protein